MLFLIVSTYLFSKQTWTDFRSRFATRKETKMNLRIVPMDAESEGEEEKKKEEEKEKE